MAQPTMAAVAGLKETYVQLKTRMEKAVDDFRKESIFVENDRLTRVNTQILKRHAHQVRNLKRTQSLRRDFARAIVVNPF